MPPDPKKPDPPAPPPAPPAPEPAPAPTGTGGSGQLPPPAPAPAGPPEDVAGLKAALESERSSRLALEGKLAKLEQANMTESEKALAKARDEGRAEAAAAAAKLVAAAEFRAAAVGKLADPEAALALLDMGKFITAEGTADRKAIAAAVSQLTPATPPPGGRIPPGPREPDPEPDFIRSAIRGARA